MSADATGWVYRHSPYTGVTFAVHLAIADSVNDQNGNELWMKKAKLSEKARVSTGSTKTAMALLVEDGFLELMEESHGRNPSRYRFLFPDEPVVFEARWQPTGQPLTGSTGQLETPTGQPATPTGQSGAISLPHKEGSQRNPRDPKKGRRSQLPRPFTVTEAMMDWVTAEVPSIDWRGQTKLFVDHHVGHGTLMVDWVAAWKKWLRQSDQWRREKAGSHNGNSSGSRLARDAITGAEVILPSPPGPADPDADLEFDEWMAKHDPSWRPPADA